MPELRTADIIARRLYEAGCRHAFGMPGGEVLTLFDALQKIGIRITLVKHENTGGFIAEGVHHVDGAPAILIATVGPGVLNCVNVVANAFQDKVPMILLTGCIDADEAERYTHQVVDQSAVFAPITKASMTLNASAADVMIDKAVTIAQTGRAGPVHIDVPISVADARVPDSPTRAAMPSPMQPAPGPELDTARTWLRETKRPVMIAGLDILAEDAAGTVAQFCKTHQIPIITSYKAKGVLPESHPLALGGAGLSPLADQTLLPFVQSADLVLCVGYDPVEMRPGWQDVWDPAKQNVIDITAEPNRHYMHQTTLSFVTSIAATLTALGTEIPANQTWENGEIAEAKNALTAAFAPEETWGPGVVIDECNAVLPSNAFVTVDSGAHRILFSQMWRCEKPHTLLQSSGFCTMGCAVPLAIGAKLAAPNRQAVGFVGDAGLLMGAGELATAAELGGNPIFVVFVDASLSLIEMKQRQRQLKNEAVDFAQHDFAAIADAFGGTGVRVRSRAELRKALQAAMASETFTLIAAEIDRGVYDGRI